MRPKVSINMIKQNKKMLDKSLLEWVEKIKNEVYQLGKEEMLSNIGKGFVLWILINYFDIDREIAITQIIDNPGDKRVDAFVEEDEVIKILQCKFFENPTKEVGSKDIVLFKTCLDWLKKPEEIRKLNLDRLYDAAVTFSERWREGVDVQLHFFAFGKFASDAEHERTLFNNTPEIKERIQMYFHDINDIITLYRVKLQTENPLINETINIKLVPGEYFIKKGKMRSIVATIKGEELLKMYRKYGDSLFEKNIRLYKGIRKGSINAGIIDTILNRKERGNFWYYNNGISFVCQSFSIKEKTNPPILIIQGFQVINGCQTTVCLSEAKERMQKWKAIPKDVEMIVRFIEAPIKKVDLITLYTNSQNPVSEIQLKSNDPLQKRLKEDFAKYSPPYFYSIKEGDWRRLSPEERKKFSDRVIEMSLAAQALYSFTTDPAFARRWKIKLFSEPHLPQQKHLLAYHRDYL